MKKNIIIAISFLLFIVVTSFYLWKEQEKKEKLEDKKMNIKENVSNDTNFDFNAKTVKLNSGYDMPIIGLGTWTQNDETTENSVYFALKDGYRLIDTAQYYGNEVGVGNGIQKAIKEGFVTREEIFITTKVSPSNYYNTASSIEESLRKLQVDYIDLIFIHQRGSNDEEVYKAMEQAVNEGKVKSKIGRAHV